MVGQTSFSNRFCGLHVLETHRRPHESFLRSRPSERSQLLHFSVAGEVHRLHVHRARSSSSAAARSQSTRIRSAVERHSAQSQSAFSHLHRSDSTDADSHFASIPLLTPDARHGEEDGFLDVQCALWQPETLPGLVPATVPVDAGIAVSTMWFDPLYRRSDPPVQWSPLLRYNSSLGCTRLALHHLYSTGRCCQCQIGSLLRLVFLWRWTW